MLLGWARKYHPRVLIKYKRNPNTSFRNGNVKNAQEKQLAILFIETQVKIASTACLSIEMKI